MGHPVNCTTFPVNKSPLEACRIWRYKNILSKLSFWHDTENMCGRYSLGGGGGGLKPANKELSLFYKSRRDLYCVKILMNYTIPLKIIYVQHGYICRPSELEITVGYSVSNTIFCLNGSSKTFLLYYRQELRSFVFTAGIPITALQPRSAGL